MDVRQSVIIFVEQTTPRIEYVAHYLFKHLCSVEYRIVSDEESFAAETTSAKLNYSNRPISGSFQIEPTGFLFEKGIREFSPIFKPDDNFGELFILTKEGAVPENGSDVLDCIFYCLSRYEEYKTEQHDRHGRFECKNSWMYEAGVLEKPWLDYKVNAFFLQFKESTGFQNFQPKYKFVPSIDLDYGYRYKGKGIVRFFGGLFKDIKNLDFQHVLGRIKVNLGGMKDPYDNYNEIYQYHQERKLPLITFILNAKYGKFDRGLKRNGSSVASVAKLAKSYGLDFGVHPSYQSHQSFDFLKKEVRGLAKKTNLKVRKSRQHFLKFYLPKTFNQLAQLGVKHDYSMGYAQVSGFRAGTCRPFYLYDLNEEKRMSIQMHSTAIMEGTYFDYLRVTPEKALIKMKEIVDEVKAVNGELITIWHEKQLAADSPWKNVYYSLAEYAMEKN